MALANYSDLQAAIANYLARPGDTLVATPAPDFIALAESRIAYGCRHSVPVAPAPHPGHGEERGAHHRGGPGCGSGGGTANAHTASLPATPALVPGFTVKFTAAASNSGRDDLQS